MTISGAAFLDALRGHRLLDEDTLDRLDAEFHPPPADAGQLADEMRRRGLLTAFQIGVLLLGKPADLVLGQYVLLERLGEGGMGQVFKANHRVLKSLRAVKIIRPDCITSKATVKRFYREVELVARLKHPNIIHAYDADQAGDRHYFVMEYAPGQDLAHVLRQTGPLPIGRACDYIRQAAMGLQHAHEHGLVHRDIKPSNMLLSTEDGCVKVLDLGLAKLRETTTEGDDAARPMTPAGMMMGTPDFMAPEQAEDAARADIRADIYSLGCTLYQLVAGRVPFPGSSLVEKLTKHYSEKPLPLAESRTDVPPGVQAIVDRMMAKLPEQRYQTPAAVAEALKPYCEGGVGPGLIGEPTDTAATVAPGTRIGPSIVPPGESIGTSVASDAGDSAYIPQTMQLPPDELSGRRLKPRPGQDGRTAIMSQAPYSLTEPPPDTAVGRMTPATAPRPTKPAAPPTRKPWMIVVGGALVIAAVVLIGLQSGWFGKGESSSGTEVVKRDREDIKDRDEGKTKDTDVKPRDEKGTKEKVTVNPNPMPITRKPLGIAKGREESSPGQVGQAKAGKAVDAVVVRGMERSREDWQKPEVITPLSQVVQVAFAAEAKYAIVRTKSLIYKHDLQRKSPPEIISPFLLLGGFAGAGSILGDAVASPDGRFVVFITVSKTEKPVRGKVSLNTEYDTIVATDGSAPLFFFGDVADSKDGALIPKSTSLAVTPDGNSLLVGSDQQLKRWAVVRDRDHSDRPAAVFEAGGPVAAVAVSPNGRYGVAGLLEHGMRLFQLEKKDDIGREYEDQGDVRVVAFFGNDRLISGHSKGKVCIWDVDVTGGSKPVAPRFKREWHKSAVTAVASQGDVFATGSLDGELALGRVAEARPEWKGKLDGSPVKALVFAPDGSSVLYATEKVIGRLPLIAPSPASAKPVKEEPIGKGKKDIVQS